MLSETALATAEAVELLQVALGLCGVLVSAWALGEATDDVRALGPAADPRDLVVARTRLVNEALRLGCQVVLLVAASVAVMTPPTTPSVARTTVQWALVLVGMQLLGLTLYGRWTARRVMAMTRDLTRRRMGT